MCQFGVRMKMFAKIKDVTISIYHSVFKKLLYGVQPHEKYVV